MTVTAKQVIHPEGPCFSRLIYGTWRILDAQDPAKSSPSAILHRIKHCISKGITTFDLADIYGGGQHQAEKRFGEALELQPELRSQIQLITKCGIVLASENGPKHYNTSKEYIRKRVEESLEAVKTHYFDLVLIHRPDPFMDASEVASAMNELHNEGKVRYFGVSNFLAHQLDVLQSRLQFPLVTNQIEMSVLRLSPLYDGTLDQAQKLKFSPLIWSPLAGGTIFKDAEGREDVLRVQNALKVVGKKYGDYSLDQVAFAWLLAHPAKLHPILGTNEIDRITSAVKALELNLRREDWFYILEASNGKRVP